jgi:hypothetical protein
LFIYPIVEITGLFELGASQDPFFVSRPQGDEIEL